MLLDPGATNCFRLLFVSRLAPSGETNSLGSKQTRPLLVVSSSLTAWLHALHGCTLYDFSGSAVTFQHRLNAVHRYSKKKVSKGKLAIETEGGGESSSKNETSVRQCILCLNPPASPFVWSECLFFSSS